MGKQVRRGAMEAVSAVIQYPSIPKIGKGTREADDDLVCWLQAIHTAHIWANEQRDGEAYSFFFRWYCSIAE
jgi:hypothetical protein